MSSQSYNIEKNFVNPNCKCPSLDTCKEGSLVFQSFELPMKQRNRVPQRGEKRLKFDTSACVTVGVSAVCESCVYVQWLLGFNVDFNVGFYLWNIYIFFETGPLE